MSLLTQRGAIEIHRRILQLQDMKMRIAELDVVIKILSTTAWDEKDVKMRLTQKNRLDTLTFELERHGLLGGDGCVDCAGGVMESPFWYCVEQARKEILLCLQIHQGLKLRVAQPEAILANTNVCSRVPGGSGQVHVIFPLVTLLYATFDIRVPHLRRINLWSALKVYITDPVGHTTSTVPTFECLDFKHCKKWYPGDKDVHALKQNMRKDRFKFEKYPVDGRYRWSTETIMPWTTNTSVPTILTELVGYTKYVQSVYNIMPNFDPFTEMLSECSVEKELLQVKVEKMNFDVKDIMVHTLTPTNTNFASMRQQLETM